MMIAVCRENAIYIYTYMKMTLLGKCPWTFEEAAAQETLFQCETVLQRNQLQSSRSPPSFFTQCMKKSEYLDYLTKLKKQEDLL